MKRMQACIDHYDEVEAESAQAATERYGAYQAFLGNIMLVSTLILGFILTGTMLGIGLTGTENFSSSQMLDFLQWVSAAGFLALFTLLIAFAVQARGTDAYTRRGGLHAFRMMKRSVLLIMVTEALLYMSLLCFGFSLKNYIMMTYLGPPICPAGRGSEYELHEQSFCAVLGRDIYGLAGTTCPDDALPKMCELKGECLPGCELWFGWEFRDNDMTNFQAVADEASIGLCGAAAAKSREQAACAQGGEGATVAELQVCASASTARHLADSCADGKRQDIEKCRRVCTWPYDDEFPSGLIRNNMQVLVVVTTVIIALLAFFRVLNSCCTVVAFMKQDVKKHGFFKSFCVQLGAETSDDEEQK